MNEDKNNTILIRSMNNIQVKALEDYKLKFGHKTNSKAVLSMIERYQNKIDLIESQKDKILELERKLNKLNTSVSDFVCSFENLKTVIS